MEIPVVSFHGKRELLIASLGNSANPQNVALPKPFLKWVGGKTQLLPELINHLPKDFSERVTTYMEPFLGGGAFLFWILQHRQNIQRVLVNDANTALINVYLTIRDKPEELTENLLILKKEYEALSTETQRGEYYYQRREAFNKNCNGTVAYAANLIFLNKTCFNGLYRSNAKGAFNVPYGRYLHPLICDLNTIYADSKALQDVEIQNVDFAEAVREADENTFVYFDPPYRPLTDTSSFCSYCKGGFNDDQQRRLAQCCRELDARGTRWMLSNSDPKEVCPTDNFFEKLYEGFSIYSVLANRMVNSNAQKRGKIGELLISNY